MAQRRFAIALLLALVFPTGCSDSGAPAELPADLPTALECEETVTGVMDHVAGAPGAPTLTEALTDHLADDSYLADTDLQVVERKRSRGTAVVRREGEVVGRLEASRSRHGWLVDTVERCTDSR